MGACSLFRYVAATTPSSRVAFALVRAHSQLRGVGDRWRIACLGLVVVVPSANEGRRLDEVCDRTGTHAGRRNDDEDTDHISIIILVISIQA